ncbi:hypothetical protein G3I44_14515 [Halogeometricum borinquense]|uniref:Uncharacterized protein n=1 Tax=Halogeometricum borinquense TaxID=60847 RepID=A0A6C0UJP2_9EURY|nr:OB-fold nucleic acid binding domain-containing protein [Halogeometricum borinquense]QIB75400.1 hypothetical protein G3I44_14515 [Halogeometricum borinquense]
MGFIDTNSADDSSENTPSASVELPGVETILPVILAETDLTEKEVWEAAAEKQDEIAFLTDTQALWLTATDHGIDLSEELGTGEESYELEVQSLEPDMSWVDITVTVRWTTDVHEFEREDKETGETETGRVRNIVVGDDTGTTQITLWDEQTAVADKVEKGDTLRVERGYTKYSEYLENQYGCPAEIRIGDQTSLIKK